MSPFSFQNSNQIGEKMKLGKHSIFDRILHGFFYRFSFDLGRQLGTILAPETRPRRHQDGSQNEVRDILRSSGDFLVDLTPSWRNLGSNWEDLGLRFGSFWCPCIHIFRTF